MWGLPLAFTIPLALLALALLPVLYFLLRASPPRPHTLRFPPLPLIRDLVPEASEPKRMPPWLLWLRLIIMALIILAMSGPVWAPERATLERDGPVLLLLDSGWASAPDWTARQSAAETIINEAQRTGRTIGMVALASAPAPIALLAPGDVLEKIRALKPSALMPARDAHLETIAAFVREHAPSEAVWLTDGLTNTPDDPFTSRLSTMLAPASLTLLDTGTRTQNAIAGIENSAEGFTIRVIRPKDNLATSGRLIARDTRGTSLGEAPYLFADRETEISAKLALPSDLRNESTSIELVGTQSAGAVALLDDSNHRRRVGIVSGSTVDVSQPLLSPTWYVSRALAPFADLREPRQGITDAIATLLDEKISVLVLADIGALPDDLTARLETFLTGGGVILRFAGARLAADDDPLVPVRLRRGGRTLGGALAWDTPKTLAQFEETSPFYGLVPPKEVAISRQLLAEPEADLPRKTWAMLDDNTPIVTAERRGKGYLVLMHVTADTSWSSLPISGLFVEMLRRIVSLSTTSGTSQESGDVRTKPLPPLKIMNGYGVLEPPPPTLNPVPPNTPLVPALATPPGLYGDPAKYVAINPLGPKDTLHSLNLQSPGLRLLPLSRPQPVELRSWLLVMAAIGFAIDSLAVLLLSGYRLGRRPITLFLLAACLGAASLALPDHARAETATLSPKDTEGALKTRLAYIVTGDAAIDEISRAGLQGLSDFVRDKTSFEPADPVGVDLLRDELAVYPLLYWPIIATRPPPDDAAMRRLGNFMQGGGIVIFDTRDAANSKTGLDTTPETRALRMILAGMSVPDLEPLPPDHVLTKAFYLIDRIPGRYATGTTWIEATAPVTSGTQEPAQPVRAGDSVSPVLITGNDLAAAWATDRRGEPLFPLDQSMPRQRDMAFRAGVNIVMYALTGNYKADQVHVPALLERLGN